VNINDVTNDLCVLSAELLIATASPAGVTATPIQRLSYRLKNSYTAHYLKQKVVVLVYKH